MMLESDVRRVFAESAWDAAYADLLFHSTRLAGRVAAAEDLTQKDGVQLLGALANLDGVEEMFGYRGPPPGALGKPHEAFRAAKDASLKAVKSRSGDEQVRALAALLDAASMLP